MRRDQADKSTITGALAYPTAGADPPRTVGRADLRGDSANFAQPPHQARHKHQSQRVRQCKAIDIEFDEPHDRRFGRIQPHAGQNQPVSGRSAQRKIGYLGTPEAAARGPLLLPNLGLFAPRSATWGPRLRAQCALGVPPLVPRSDPRRSDELRFAN